MNRVQLDAIAETLRFLTSNWFIHPYSVKSLNGYCNKYIKKLNDAGVKQALVSEFQTIFNAEIYKYI